MPECAEADTEAAEGIAEGPADPVPVIEEVAGHSVCDADPLRAFLEIDIPVAIDSEPFLQADETGPQGFLEEIRTLEILRKQVPALHFAPELRRHLGPGVADELVAVKSVAEGVDFILALEREIHPGEQVVVLIRPAGDGRFEEGVFRFHHAGRPPADINPLIENHQSGLLRVDLREFFYLFVKMEIEIVARVIQQGYQQAQKFELVVGQNQVGVSGHRFMAASFGITEINIGDWSVLFPLLQWRQLHIVPIPISQTFVIIFGTHQFFPFEFVFGTIGKPFFQNAISFFKGMFVV